MIIQGPNDVYTADKIFITMDNSQGQTLVRGTWVDIDEANQDGQGVRRSRGTGDARYSNWTIVGCVETRAEPEMDSRVLIQIYGFHDAAYYNNNNINTLGLGVLVSHDSTLGAAQNIDPTAITLGEEPEKLAGFVGYSLVQGTGLTYQPAIIRCM